MLDSEDVALGLCCFFGLCLAGGTRFSITGRSREARLCALFAGQSGAVFRMRFSRNIINSQETTLPVNYGSYRSYKFHLAEWDQCYGGPSAPGSFTGVGRWVGTVIGVVGASVHVRR